MVNGRQKESKINVDLAGCYCHGSQSNINFFRETDDEGLILECCFRYGVCEVFLCHELKAIKWKDHGY